MNPKITPEQDIRHIHNELVCAGFHPPVTAYFRQDPRGSEYGIYRVDILDGDNIRVTYLKDCSTAHLDASLRHISEGDYSMRFYEIGHLVNWARNTF